jgi:hypothetical protein
VQGKPLVNGVIANHVIECQRQCRQGRLYRFCAGFPQTQIKRVTKQVLKGCCHQAPDPMMERRSKDCSCVTDIVFQSQCGLYKANGNRPLITTTYSQPVYNRRGLGLQQCGRLQGVLSYRRRFHIRKLQLVNQKGGHLKEKSFV